MQEMEAKIRKIIAASVNIRVPAEEIGSDDSLSDFGINSMNYIKIIVAIETEFGVTFDNEALRFDKLNTINKMAAHISSLMK